MLHIVDLYLHPPQDGLLFSLDEKPGIQALERKYPDQPTQPGQSYRREHSYERHGTQDLLAAFEVSCGNAFAMTLNGHSWCIGKALSKNLFHNILKIKNSILFRTTILLTRLHSFAN